MDNKHYLDLDAVSSDVDFTLKLNGKEHALAEPSVEDFIANLKEVQNLSLNVGPLEELEMSIRMILRAFPTIEELELRKMKLVQLRKIVEFTRQAGGEEVEQTEGEQSNPPKAD